MSTTIWYRPADRDDIPDTLTYDEAVQTAGVLTEYELAEECRYMLDETLPEVKIGSLSYGAGHVLEAVDPIAFRCEVSDYASENYVELNVTEED